MATKKGLHFWASLAGLFLLASELLKTSSSLSIAGVATSFLLHNPITALLLMFIFPIVTGFLLFTKQEAAETWRSFSRSQSRSGRPTKQATPLWRRYYDYWLAYPGIVGILFIPLAGLPSYSRPLMAALLYLVILSLSSPIPQPKPRRPRRPTNKTLEGKRTLIRLVYFVGPAAIVSLTGLCLLTFGYGNFILGWSFGRLPGYFLTHFWRNFRPPETTRCVPAI